MSPSELSPKPDRERSSYRSPSDGTLLGLLLLGLYSLFTLLPGSHSMMVSWPWVFIWQVTLALPMLWLLWQLWFKPWRQFSLGTGFDRAIAFLTLGLFVSTLFADFPNQARWYAWAALGGISAIYAVSGWLNTPERVIKLLRYQAALGCAFIVASLGLWLFQTYLPELSRLEQLQQFGIAETFSFNRLSLRNWHPIGHQNYVAGYLLLILPLLGGLSLMRREPWRWLWISGCLLGIVDLYTTSSRGGVLALLLTAVVGGGITLWRSRLSKLQIGLASGMIVAVLTGGVLSNPRTRNSLSAILQGNFASGELAYRWITNVTGWRIGLEHPLVGAGPGSVPLLYQRYRPYWAGREAELHFQLHSTPAQLWAELGGWGILAGLILIVLIAKSTWQWARFSPHPHQLPRPIVWSLLAGLVAYGFISLTDYQLDNLCISGAIALYLTVLGKAFSPSGLATQQETKTSNRHRAVPIAGLGVVLAVCWWLSPVHRAWAASSQAFQALQKEDQPTFTAQLQKAHTLAPWEAYYPYQLGWYLGNLSFQTPDEFRAPAIDWFTQGNQASPYQEFGQSNLGWLSMSVNAEAAKNAFTQSVQLVPAKPGVFLGLGYSLLRLGQPELASQALTLEVLRHPLIISSGIWKFPQFAPLYASVLQQSIEQCSMLLNNASPRLETYVHRLRGSLYWWQGDLTAAATDWEKADVEIAPSLIAISRGEILSESFATLATTPAKLSMQAWQQPQEREVLLTQALISTSTVGSQVDAEISETQIEQLITSMNTAESFDDWLKQTAPIVQPRNERLGFGVLSRHVDGINPKDYLPLLDNLPVKRFFEGLFLSSSYFPELDEKLQPMREKLLISAQELPN